MMTQDFMFSALQIELFLLLQEDTHSAMVNPWTEKGAHLV
jgi:hypothetical protein